MKKEEVKKIEENKTGNNRRDFIKNTALAAAAFMIVPRHVLGRGFVAPSDRLLIASIGVGGKDSRILPCFTKAVKLLFPSFVMLMIEELQKVSMPFLKRNIIRTGEKCLIKSIKTLMLFR